MKKNLFILLALGTLPARSMDVESTPVSNGRAKRVLFPEPEKDTRKDDMLEYDDPWGLGRIYWNNFGNKNHENPVLGIPKPPLAAFENDNKQHLIVPPEGLFWQIPPTPRKKRKK